MKNVSRSILFLLCLAPQLAFADATQFFLEDTIGGTSKARIYVAADVASQSQVQDALYRATDHAKAAFLKLDTSNPNSELSQTNQKKAAGSYTVSPELAQVIEVAQAISKQTDGSFDITFNSPSGNFRSIQVDTKSNQLTIKNKDLIIDLRYILSGFLADLIAEDLATAGWKNALVKVDDAFVANGSDVNEAWKIPVVSPTTSSAKRALLYRSTDVGAATLNGKNAQDIINPKTRSVAVSDLKSVTIFTPGAARSEGLATAIYVMGRDNGRVFLLSHKKIRGVFGDAEGKLTNIPEFK